jgi:tetraacyldisaccharide 4'-kinase
VTVSGIRPWLAPLGAVFGAGAAARAALYRRGVLPQARLRGPVISVGNLSVGGSGKTPVVALLAERLRDLGHPVAILSRGYGGRFRGEALVVSEGGGPLVTAAEAGDEPAMLARRLPGVVVAVGPRRDAVGRHVEARFGPRVHLLDDGFQHLRLARDLDVVCLDPADLEDRPLPAGRLREFRSALDRAHLLLLAGTPPDGPLLQALGRGRCYAVSRRLEPVRGSDGRERALPARVWLVSGIARPERFAADVRALRLQVAGHSAFPDHHVFRDAELRAVEAAARAAGAEALLTTEKDAERIGRRDGTPELLVVRLTAVVCEEARLLERVAAVASGRPA